jgi:hypothetical protein
MTIEDYQVLIAETAQQFIDDNSDPARATTRPETAFQELIDNIVDRNWSDEDAFACLRYSKFPSAETFNTGGYKPASQQQSFPFKAFALPAFAEDVKDAIARIGFDWEAYDNAEETEPIDNDTTGCTCVGKHDATCAFAGENNDAE